MSVVKAPIDAQWYGSEGCYLAGWYKLEGDQWWFFYQEDEGCQSKWGKLSGDNRNPFSYRDDLVAVNSESSDEGVEGLPLQNYVLPPIGYECESRKFFEGKDSWKTFKLLAVGDSTFYAQLGEDEVAIKLDYQGNYLFREKQTEEAIAKEVKFRFVESVISKLNLDGISDSHALVAELYDKGLLVGQP